MLTLWDVKVNVPRYKVIALGKDLQADILPPPEYILEAYALTMEIHGVEQKEHREILLISSWGEPIRKFVCGS